PAAVRVADTRFRRPLCVRGRGGPTRRLRGLLLGCRGTGGGGPPDLRRRQVFAASAPVAGRRAGRLSRFARRVRTWPSRVQNRPGSRRLCRPCRVCVGFVGYHRRVVREEFLVVLTITNRNTGFHRAVARTDSVCACQYDRTVYGSAHPHVVRGRADGSRSSVSIFRDLHE